MSILVRLVHHAGGATLSYFAVESSVEHFSNGPLPLLKVYYQYPLVNSHIAIEHGHRNSEFSHEKWWSFHSYVAVYQRVSCFAGVENSDSQWENCGCNSALLKVLYILAAWWWEPLGLSGHWGLWLQASKIGTCWINEWLVVSICFTLWLFNIAMENDPLIDDLPIKTVIFRGYLK